MSGRVRTSAVLGATSMSAGLLAYVLFAMLTRHLGAADAAPVTILWTYWGLSAAAITFPVQHWLAHAITAGGGGLSAPGRVLGRLALLLLGASLVAGGISWALRQDLFGRDDAAFPGLVALMTAGAFVMGLSRGALTARRRFGTLGATLLGEQVVRVVGTAALIVPPVDDPVPFGAVIVAGSFVTLAWPGVLRVPRAAHRAATSSFAALGSAAAAQLLGQLVLTGGPIILAVQGGAPALVTAMFAALAVFRAPFILAQSQVAAFTGRWTQLVTAGRYAELRRVRQVLLVGAGPLTLAAAGVGAVVGGPVVRLVFGDEIEVSRVVAALIAAASTLAVVNLAATVLSIAHARPVIALTGWLVGGSVGLGALLGPWDPEVRTAAFFLLAEAVTAVVMLVALRRAAVVAENRRSRSGRSG